MPSAPNLTVEAAISQVLGAEAMVREAVALCQRQADEIIEQARIRRKRIADRTDQRISMLRSRFAQHVAQQLAALEAEIKEYSGQPIHDAAQLSSLDAAVQSLAAELSGESP